MKFFSFFTFVTLAQCLALQAHPIDKRATQQEVQDQVFNQQKVVENGIENAFKLVVGNRVVEAVDGVVDPVLGVVQNAVAFAAGKAFGTAN
jgi:hypothetical protein